MRKLLSICLLLVLAAACSGGSTTAGGTADTGELLAGQRTPLRLDIAVRDAGVRAQGAGVIAKVALDLLDPETLRPIREKIVAERNGQDRIIVNVLGVKIGRTVLRAQGLAADGSPVGLPAQRTVELVTGVSLSITLALDGRGATRLDLSPPSASLNLGTNLQMTATAILDGNASQNVSDQVTWTSSNPGVASVSSTGLVTALGEGQTNIVARLGQLSQSASITVVNQTINSLAVTPPQASVGIGGVVNFQALANFGEGDQAVNATWTSSAPGVATVDANGVATGLSEGNAVILANFQGLSANATMTVTAATIVSIAVSPVNTTVAAGMNVPFTATATLSDNTTQDVTNQVTWSSSIPTFATISPTTGLASGVTEGVTTITATLDGISGSTPLNVTNSIVSIAVTPASLDTQPGVSQQYTATATFSDGTMRDVTNDPNLSWASSNLTVATINAGGLATTLDTGFTFISATLAGVTGETALNVNALVVSREFFLVTGGNNELKCFEIASDGLMTHRDSANFGAGNNGNNITISPDRQFALVNTFPDNMLRSYQIDPATGTLTQVDIEATGDGPSRGAFLPGGAFFFQPNQTASPTPTVSVYAYAGGQLTPIGGSPFTLPLGSRGPQMLYVHPSNHIYLGTVGAPLPPPGNVVQMDIAPGGTLTIPTTNTFNTPTFVNVFGITSNNGGSKLYTAGSGNNIDVFDIAGNGNLTLSVQFAAGGGRLGEVETGVNAPNLLYVTDFDNNQVRAFPVGAAGVLGPLATGFPVATTGTFPLLIAQSPSGGRMIVEHQSSSIVTIYDVAANGSLTPNIANGAGGNFDTGVPNAFGIAITQLP